MFLFVKQDVVELKAKSTEEEKPIYSYYKKVMETSIPKNKIISDNINLKYHEANFYDSYVSNILNPTTKF